MTKNDFENKKLLTENRIILNEQGEVEFLLNDVTRQKGYFDI